MLNKAGYLFYVFIDIAKFRFKLEIASFHFGSVTILQVKVTTLVGCVGSFVSTVMAFSLTPVLPSVLKVNLILPLSPGWNSFFLSAITPVRPHAGCIFFITSRLVPVLVNSNSPVSWGPCFTSPNEIFSWVKVIPGGLSFGCGTFLFTKNAENDATRTSPKIKNVILPALPVSIIIYVKFIDCSVLISPSGKYLYKLMLKKSRIRSSMILSQTSDVEEGFTLKHPQEISSPLISACDKPAINIIKSVEYNNSEPFTHLPVIKKIPVINSIQGRKMASGLTN